MAVQILCTVCSSCSRPITKEFRYGHEILWRESQSRCAPSYPEVSIASGTEGLAVALLEFGKSGNVTRVDVLQSPDDPIKKSVASCAERWRILPVDSPDSQVHRLGASAETRRTGKLYFYFIIAFGKPTVYLANDPDERGRLLALARAEKDNP